MLLNRKLWKKAYLIEFWQNGSLCEAFTFSVPPQSEEFSYPQRLNETKTFGGSVFEDYGNDTVQITLSGSTINQELKLIYRGTKQHRLYLSGEDEIFYLKDLIAEYGKFNKIPNKNVYLYELVNGKHDSSERSLTVSQGEKGYLKSNGSLKELDTSITATAKGRNKSHKNFRIWIQNFDIKRSKDKPFTYDYTLKALGLPLTNLGSKVSKLTESISSILSDLDSSLETWYNLFDVISENADYYFSQIESIISAIETGYQTICDWIAGAIDTTTNLITEVDGLGNKIVNVLPNMISYTNVLDSCTDLVNACDGLAEWYSGYKTTSAFEQACDTYQISQVDFDDACTNLIRKLQKGANKTYSRISEELSEHKQFPLVVPGSDGETDSVIKAYGYKEYIFHDGDTWASIAYQVYGDASYSAMLQLYNSETELDNLSAGSTVYIPMLSQTQSSDNQVNSTYGSKDSFGKDLLIVDKDYSHSHHDLSTSKGVKTVQQAIDNRLNTTLNSRIRNVVYGIRNESGLSADEVEACESYISASIEQTILADPRIDSIESLTWTGVGSQLSVKVRYKTIVGSTQYYEGVL